MPATHDRVMRAVNRFPALLLRSPLHGVLSDGVLLLGFAGRKSGRHYTTPINYLRDDAAGDTLLLTTDSPWWKNLRGGALVTLRIRGREYVGVAEAVTDEAEVARVLQMMLKEYPGYGKYVGLRHNPEGQIDRAQLRKVARERVVVRVRLEAPKVGSGGPEGANRKSKARRKERSGEDTQSNTDKAPAVRDAGGVRAGSDGAGVDEPRGTSGRRYRGGRGGYRRACYPGSRRQERQNRTPYHRRTGGGPPAR